MTYIIIGLLLSIGWHLAKLVYEAVHELLFCRLHDAKWYRIVAGKEPEVVESDNVNTVKNQIGFKYTEKTEL